MTIGSEGQSRPIPRMHADSAAPDVAHVVSKLCDILGVKLVAYIGHESGTRAVRDWAAGERTPSEGIVQRLHVAYYVAGLLHEREGKATVQSWFRGLNPQLDDNAPAQALRDNPLEIATREVVAAAHAFSAVG